MKKSKVKSGKVGQKSWKIDTGLKIISWNFRGTYEGIIREINSKLQ